MWPHLHTFKPNRPIKWDPATLCRQSGLTLKAELPAGGTDEAARRQASERPSRASHCDDWTFGPDHHRLGGHIQPVDAVHANSNRASPPPRFSRVSGGLRPRWVWQRKLKCTAARCCQTFLCRVARRVLGKPAARLHDRTTRTHWRLPHMPPRMRLRCARPRFVRAGMRLLPRALALNPSPRFAPQLGPQIRGGNLQVPLL